MSAILDLVWNRVPKWMFRTSRAISHGKDDFGSSHLLRPCKTTGFYNIRTMKHLPSGSLSRQQFLALLLKVFAVLALVLAGIGVYTAPTGEFVKGRKGVKLQRCSLL